MRTKPEIADEINALKALKPVGPHARNTQSKIDLAIDELNFGVDDTAAEWNEMSESERDIVMTTRNWKTGGSADKPSKGWGSLVEERTQ